MNSSKEFTICEINNDFVVEKMKKGHTLSKPDELSVIGMERPQNEV
jgi:hypothetical protein